MTETTNPVGEPKLNLIAEKVIALEEEWNKKQKELPNWWEFWKPGTSLYEAVKFLFMAVDQLVIFSEKVMAGESGPDKKATVLLAIGQLFDYSAKYVVPIWMKPFEGTVKKIVVGIVVAQVIDFIVTKYNEGAWKNNGENNQIATKV